MLTGTTASGGVDATVRTVPEIAPPLASAKSMPVVVCPTATGTGVPPVNAHERAGHGVPACSWSMYPAVLVTAT